MQNTPALIHMQVLLSQHWRREFSGNHGTDLPFTSLTPVIHKVQHVPAVVIR